MGTVHFSKSEAFRFGWAIAKSNIVFFVVVFIEVFLIMYVIPIVVAVFAGTSIPAAVFLGIVSMVTYAVATMGLFNITLQFCTHKKAVHADFFSISSLYVPYLIASFLFSLIIMGLFVLPVIPLFIFKSIIALPISAVLLVPAVVVIFRLQFYGFIIIDNKAGPIEALKKSYEITKGSVWNLFLFSILFVALIMLGSLALIVGLFVTLPVSLVAYAHVYRSLAGQPAATAIALPKTKNLRAIERTFNPDVDIYSMTCEEFTQRLENM